MARHTLVRTAFILTTILAVTLMTNRSAVAQANIYVPGNEINGVTWTTPTTGTYRFTITGGAFSPWGCDAQFSEPDCSDPGSKWCWGWHANTIGCIDRSPWSSCPPQNCQFEAPACDFAFGDGCYWTTSQKAEAASLGMFVDVSLNVGQVVLLLAPDHKGFYAANRGGVYVSIRQIYKPIASFAYSPDKPMVGENITFDASASYDTDGTIESYQWDFGDGNTSSGQMVTYNYTQPDKYTITLTVTDNDGLMDSIQQDVTVGVPVILVHGWRPALTDLGQVATWEILKSRLEAEGIPYYEFDYLPADGNPVAYAYDLKKFVDSINTDTKFTGKFDIVCHSMGAMVSRYYIENLGGADKTRLWIGIAPVNQGAAIADDILIRTLRFLVPSLLRKFFPDMTIDDPALEHMRTISDTVRKLNYDGIATNIIYKVIVGYNGTRRESFCGLSGRTWAKNLNNPHYLTYQGDGAVAIEQSKLPGNFGIDCINDVNHSSILSSSEVLTRVIAYLKDPGTSSLNNTPPPDPTDDLVAATDNRGILPHGIQKQITFDVDSSVQKTTVISDWLGSDIDLQIITPSQQVLNSDEYPVIEYLKEDGVIYYLIDAPTPGTWTANLIPVDVPQKGEPYSFDVFYTSPLVLNLTTTEETYDYPAGASATIIAQLTDINGAVTGATVSAQILRPDLSTDEVVLYDDATHGDFVANDGNYTNFYSLLTDGDYVVSVYANGIIAGSLFERMDIKTLHANFNVDFNRDGIIDFIDFATLAKYWLEKDCGYPERCEGTDLDFNGSIDFIDLCMFADHWLESIFVPILGDFSGDGKVDFIDFAIFANQWLLEKLSADIAPGKGDGIVNFLDYAVFANGWQGNMNGLADFVSQWLEPSAYCADIAPLPSGDSIVDFLDLAEFADHWLEGTSP